MARRVLVLSFATTIAIFLALASLLLLRADVLYMRSIHNECGRLVSSSGKCPAYTIPAQSIHSLPPKRTHTFNSNGLLEINPQGRHPILDLIDSGKRQWKEKNERQSRSLVEAVDEYKRRYGRMPPKGFDKWWNYVVKHNVPLPDEYDQIYRDLEPFYGVDPAALIAEQRTSEGNRWTFTIANSPEGELTPVGVNVTSAGDAKKPYAQIEFLKDVSKDIPPFRATFSSQDASSKNMYWQFKRSFVEAARAGTYFDPSSTPDPKTFGFHWDAICPPDSAMMSYLTSPSPRSSQKAFIHDHLSSMDPCHHPHHSYQVGFLHSRREGPLRHLPPVFALSKSTIHTEILAIPADQLFLDVGNDPDWEDKEDVRAFWRGSNTGLRFQYEDVLETEGGARKEEQGRLQWRDSQRVRLVDFGTKKTGLANVLAPPPPFSTSLPSSNYSNETEHQTVMEPLQSMEIPYARLNPSFVDVAFSGNPVQCDPKMCDFLKKEFEWRRKVSQSEANRYKYFIDVDGNGWSGRFRKLMSTKSLVLKATVFPEWFTDRIQPWVHYVPIQVDYSDLYDILAFFRGDLAGKNAHDELAKEIALTGKEWIGTHWRMEDMTAYMFRLMLEYSRVMSLDREAASFRFE